MKQLMLLITISLIAMKAVGYERYSRDQWAHWLDVDGDCMNTRHEVLLSSSLVEPRLSPDRCYVSKGLWKDPYSGRTFDRASFLDIDHVVPLHWAHKHGGTNWSMEEKADFANDPDNLLPVLKALNQEKSDSGPTEWLPPNQAYRCDYLFKWEGLLRKYSKLQMNPSENRVFLKMLSTCRK